MRKASILALVFCLILGLSAVAMAKGKTVKGDVTNVSTTDKSVSVKGKTADETFWTNDHTKIEVNGKTATLGDVKVGDWAEVWFTAKNGKNWANKIEAKTPKNPKKESKPAKPGA